MYHPLVGSMCPKLITINPTRKGDLKRPNAPTGVPKNYYVQVKVYSVLKTEISGELFAQS